MSTPGYRLKWLLYSFLCIVADVLDAIVCFFASEKQRDAGSELSDVDTLSDKEIEVLLQYAPCIPGAGPAPVYLLTPGTVAKLSYPLPNETADDCTEALILNTLSANTNIPVPCVRRIVNIQYGHIIVMDYIKGHTLAEVWTSYSLWQKIRVALTLRRYVRQLHRVKAPPKTPPGPLSEQGPRKCDVPSIFGPIKRMRGPFVSYEEFSAFFNKRFEMGLARLPKDDPIRDEKFDNSSPLVLVHNDLNPRNIIVGDDGRIWLIDWEWSGFYPPWFELAAMTNQVKNERSLGWSDHFWTLMIPFVCGPYFRQQVWLFKAGLGLSCS